MAERIPQILKFVPHPFRRGVIFVKRVYADENGPQLSAGIIRAGGSGWNVELDYPEVTAHFTTLPIAQAFCEGYCAAKGWTVPPGARTLPPDDTVDPQDLANWKEYARQYLALETPSGVQDALAGRLIPDVEMRLRKLEKLAHEPYDFEHLIQRLEKLEAVATSAKTLDATRLDRLEYLAESMKERVKTLEKLAHEHFVNTEDVKPSPGRGR
jgi:hypothetical protein